MGIALDTVNNKTVCTCNSCGTVAETNSANGVVAANWGTGQLWIDLSIQNIKQTAICFCPLCFLSVSETTTVVIKSEV